MDSAIPTDDEIVNRAMDTVAQHPDVQLDPELETFIRNQMLAKVRLRRSVAELGPLALDIELDEARAMERVILEFTAKTEAALEFVESRRRESDDTAKTIIDRLNADELEELRNILRSK